MPSTEYGEVFDDAGNVFERVNKPGSVQYNLDGAAKGGSTALRPVGSVLESIEDIMTNPSLLKGQSYGYIRNMVGDSKNWVNDIMRRSTRADGWVLREMNQAGNDFTGRMIQYHPGTPRHFGGAPYWKVSSGSTIFRIPLDLMFFEITVKGKDI